jgi:hypothetical protein
MPAAEPAATLQKEDPKPADRSDKKRKSEEEADSNLSEQVVITNKLSLQTAEKSQSIKSW